jgi:hypothetical protein
MKPTSESLSSDEACSIRVAEGNCGVRRPRGEQSEAKFRPRIVLPRMVNSIRPDRKASQRRKRIGPAKAGWVRGEACGPARPRLPIGGQGLVGGSRSTAPPDIPRRTGSGGFGWVFGARTERRLHGLKTEICFWVGVEAAVRTLIVVKTPLITGERRGVGR